MALLCLVKDFSDLTFCSEISILFCLSFCVLISDLHHWMLYLFLGVSCTFSISVDKAPQLDLGNATNCQRFTNTLFTNNEVRISIRLHLSHVTST